MTGHTLPEDNGADVSTSRQNFLRRRETAHRQYSSRQCDLNLVQHCLLSTGRISLTSCDIGGVTDRANQCQ